MIQSLGNHIEINQWNVRYWFSINEINFLFPNYHLWREFKWWITVDDIFKWYFQVKTGSLVRHIAKSLATADQCSMDNMYMDSAMKTKLVACQRKQTLSHSKRVSSG